jgi:hypothetical protein
MNTEQRFKDKDELQAWLISKRIPEDKSKTASDTLFDQGFDSPNSLMGISSADLQLCGLAIPLAQLLSNKLEKQQQQHDTVSCVVVYVFLCSNVLKMKNAH